MKNRTEKILLAVFLLSLALAVLFVLTWLEILPVHYLEWPYWAQVLNVCLALGFSVVPVFCLQLLLCRRVPRFLAACPALLLAGTVLCFAYAYFTAIGWDSLGYAFLLLLCIAPAVGIALAWAVYGLYKYRKRGDLHG